jgi:hypothetical protein
VQQETEYNRSMSNTAINMTAKTEFTFGYDLENVQAVEKYVRENYSEAEYEMYVGHGDDTMNALEITMRADDEHLHLLIDACDGQGAFEEEE